MSQGILLTIVIQTVGYAIGLFKVYTDMQLKLKELDMRVASVEKQDNDIVQELRNIKKMLVDIQLELKDKADKP